MRLNFNSPYLSIEQFDSVEIPDFVVLTGVNGSGKSHLLDAIDKRHVTIHGMESANVVLFNYETFRLDNEPQFNAHQLSAEREAAWQFYQNDIKGRAKSWRDGLGINYGPLKASCDAKKNSFWNLPAEVLKPYKQNAKDFFNAPQYKHHEQAQGIFSSKNYSL